MRVETEEFVVFPDGSQSNWIEGKIFLGKKEYEFMITDHTRPGQKESDKKAKRDVPYAYEISRLPYKIGEAPFEKYGFSASGYFNAVGLDENPGYEDRSSEHEFVGEPKHTIEEVKELVIKAFIDNYQFDYDKKLEEFKKKLDKRQALMDEANSYLKENGLNLEEGIVKMPEEEADYDDL